MEPEELGYSGIGTFRNGASSFFIWHTPSISAIIGHATGADLFSLAMSKEIQIKSKICPSCNHYFKESGECRLLMDSGMAKIREIFNSKPCDPSRFVRAFVTQYALKKYGSHFANEIEALVDDTTGKLLAVEPDERFLAGRPKDLIHFRRWMMVFAQNNVTEYFRKMSSADLMDGATLMAETNFPASRTPLWEDSFARSEEAELKEMIVWIMGHLEKASLRIAIIVRKSFFDNQTLEEIARDLGISVHTAARDREKGLDRLKSLFADIKLEHLYKIL
jgi:DNA-directed RNA polymerase specialized sigma24 family protein